MTLDLSPMASDIGGAFLAGGGVERARASVVAGALAEPDGLDGRRQTFGQA
ncbi:hypothetical protein [Streptomyces sp. NPDC048481]|uniref:hypothetical protein n=1 Tax=Streptomyces sp. NPDC048481 TaxID=3365557 RepID=UPI003718E058